MKKVDGNVPDDQATVPDEANQAWKAGELLETGRYQYDPEDHHGPSLYWFTLPALKSCGAKQLSDTTEAQYRVVLTMD